MFAKILFLTFILAAPMTIQAEQPAAFDHQHLRWNQLLQKHVYWIDNGVASQVDYEDFRREQATLDATSKTSAASRKTTLRSGRRSSSSPS